MIYYGIKEFKSDCQKLADKINDWPHNYKTIHGIPQGGTAIALELGHLLGLPVIEEGQLNTKPADQILVVDDLVDSGTTISRYKGHDTACLHIKTHTPQDKWPTFWISRVSDWITYWWEASEEKSIRDNVTRILQFIGEDPTREGLVKTPDRVVKSWQEIYGGYGIDPASVFTTFEADGYNELVLLRGIEFFSTCEHHMLSFSGKAHIGYIAQDRIVGISKLARLLDIYARRLQVQERIGQQVTQAIMKYLNPAGAACIIEAEHLCLSGDSLIQLAFLNREKYPNGVPIKDLVGMNGLSVYCYDATTNKIAIDKIKSIWKVGRKKVYKVTYEWHMNNQHVKEKKFGEIKVTEDHPFMLRWKIGNHYNNKKRKYDNGSFLSIKDGLTVGDSLMPFSCYEANNYYVILLNNGKIVQEHRFLLEYKLNKKLKTSEVSHHENENTLDNTFTNLEYYASRGEHSQFHNTGKTKKGHPAHNKKERNTLVCENCGSRFTTQFAYQESIRRFCKHKCYLEQRYANHKIISIEEIGMEDVYDLETERYHNFAVNGIIVHNCMRCRGVEKQNSVMVTSSLTGRFLEDSDGGRAARAELMGLIK